MKSTEYQATFITWRFYLVISILLFAIGCLITRVIYLAIIEQHFLRSQGDVRVVRVINQPAFRGMIKDRNGYPLAISTSIYSVWLNPKDVEQIEKNAKAVAHLLNVKSSLIHQLLQKNKNKEFVYLKRDVEPDIAAKLKNLKIPGVYLQQEYKRYYPEGEITAHLIGFTNVDDQGQEGLELTYNKWLAGVPGKQSVIRDRIGRIISAEKPLQEQTPGKDIVLSIDKRIQYLAYRELLAGVEKNHAESGSAIVLDVKTGEVLAMVNQPSFNPNHRPLHHPEVLRNRAITDTFEPGSTIKAFSIASAFDSGKYTPNSVIDTSPGWIKVGHKIVHDEHTKGLLTIPQILQVSSNVGTAKMILSLPPNQLWNLLHDVGFGESTYSGFPGERSGALVKPTKWSPIGIVTLAYGYGLSVTTLQLVHAYSILANDGVKLPISLLHSDRKITGEKVIKTSVAKQMLALLESVTTTKGATGEKARVTGYRIAGKTGTTIQAGVHGYHLKQYISSFVGIAPVSHPQVVVVVVIHQPKGKEYYGGLVSAPVFEKIMEGTLRILNIPPDAIV